MLFCSDGLSVLLCETAPSYDAVSTASQHR